MEPNPSASKSAGLSGTSPLNIGLEGVGKELQYKYAK